VEGGLQLQNAFQDADSFLMISLGGSLARSGREADGFLLGRWGFFCERNADRFAADLDFQGLRQKGKLALNHRLNDGVVRPLRRNRLALELEQVVDLNRD
jgi:hypothetical protein